MPATIETRITRLEQRAHSDDDTLNSVLQILQRMDQRLEMLESSVATLVADMATVKATTADTNKRIRVRGFNQ